MSAKLSTLRIAILATDGVEQSELAEPKKALEEIGVKVDLVSLEKGSIKSWQHTNWGDEFSVDVDIDAADANQYQALVLPGGVINPDKLRMNDKAISFIKKFIEQDKPIAAICHGPWTLINANGVKGKTITSWPSIKIDLVNAGANWVDKEVIRDGKLISSRKPADLKAFNAEIIKLLSELHP